MLGRAASTCEQRFLLVSSAPFVSNGHAGESACHGGVPFTNYRGCVSHREALATSHDIGAIRRTWQVVSSYEMGRTRS